MKADIELRNVVPDSRGGSIVYSISIKPEGAGELFGTVEVPLVPLPFSQDYAKLTTELAREHGLLSKE